MGFSNSPYLVLLVRGLQRLIGGLQTLFGVPQPLCCFLFPRAPLFCELRQPPLHRVQLLQTEKETSHVLSACALHLLAALQACLQPVEADRQQIWLTNATHDWETNAAARAKWLARHPAWNALLDTEPVKGTRSCNSVEFPTVWSGGVDADVNAAASSASSLALSSSARSTVNAACNIITCYQDIKCDPGDVEDRYFASLCPARHSRNAESTDGSAGHRSNV